MTDLSAFAAVFATLFTAHQIADYWVQTDAQAKTKGLPCWCGRLACARHVATYTVTALLALLVLTFGYGLPLPLVATAAGLAFSAVTHYILDRRVHLRRLALWTGKDPAWLDNGGGLLALDQSAHICALFISSVIITV